MACEILELRSELGAVRQQTTQLQLQMQDQRAVMTRAQNLTELLYGAVQNMQAVHLATLNVAAKTSTWGSWWPFQRQRDGASAKSTSVGSTGEREAESVVPSSPHGGVDGASDGLLDRASQEQMAEQVPILPADACAEQGVDGVIVVSDE
eukprot:6492720-Amphidinium_carterae.1